MLLLTHFHLVRIFGRTCFMEVWGIAVIESAQAILLANDCACIVVQYYHTLQTMVNIIQTIDCVQVR